MRVSIRLLGPLEVRCGGTLVPLSAPKERTIVVLLALNRGHTVPVERIVDLVWGQDPPPSANVSVRVLISRLRSALAGVGCLEFIRTQSHGYLIDTDRVDVDVDLFREWAGRGRALFAAGSLHEAADTLRQALTTWQGEQLAESGPGRLQGEAIRLEEERLATLELWIDARLATGGHAEVVAELDELCQRHPLRERLWSQRIVALYRCGRHADALAAYQQLRTTLVDELGLDPSAELRQLEQDVLAQHPALAPIRPDRSAPQSDRSGVPVPRQLTIASHRLVGRPNELSHLDSLLSEADDEGDVGAVCVLSGTAGAGKTALALVWAHRVSSQFPDGQLYVDLRGFDPAAATLNPAEALRGFLEALGVAGHHIPAGLDGRAGLYRSVLATKRVLVVLDNARDAGQVRPLLPGSTSCVTLVTSRNQLRGLVAAHGATHLTVNLLTASAARDMLAQRLGPERTAAKPDAVEAIIRSCGRLPLALAVIAGRAATTPTLSLEVLAAQLADNRGRLNTLAGKDPTTNVRSVLSWSYHALDPDPAQLFRLLGLNPTPEFSLTAASSLCGWPLNRTQEAIDELAEANLITEHRPRRYLLHDLLHEYARDEADRTDSSHDRHAALQRLLDHYLHTANSAVTRLNPHRALTEIAAPENGALAEPLHQPDHARSWLTREQTVLVSAVEHATIAGFNQRAYQLAHVLGDYLERQADWHALATVWRGGVAAADRLTDPTQQAHAHRCLATAYTYLDNLDEAEAHLQRSLNLATSTGDPVGQAEAHLEWSWVSDRRGDYEQASSQAQQALTLYTLAEHPAGQATALDALGWFSAQLGDHRSALQLCQQALALHQTLGDRDGQADAWGDLGYAHHHLGNYPAAIDCYRTAIQLYRDLGVHYDEALSLNALGDSLHAAGNSDAAREAWAQALARLDKLPHASAEQVRSKLQTR